MEKAGRRRLASAAPPLGRLRRRESGADEGGLGGPPGLEAPRSLERSGPDDEPRCGVGRAGPASAAAGPRSTPAVGPPAAARAVGGPRLQRSACQVTLRSGASGCFRGRSPAGRPRPPGELLGSKGGGVSAARAVALPRFARVAAAVGTAGKHLAQGSHGVQTPAPPLSSSFPDP